MSNFCASKACCRIDELNRLPTSPGTARGRSLAAELFGTLRTWRHRIRARRQLKRLDERLLHDIGVTCYQARNEWRKPFWRR